MTLLILLLQSKNEFLKSNEWNIIKVTDKYNAAVYWSISPLWKFKKNMWRITKVIKTALLHRSSFPVVVIYFFRRNADIERSNMTISITTAISVSFKKRNIWKCSTGHSIQLSPATNYRAVAICSLPLTSCPTYHSVYACAPPKTKIDDTNSVGANKSDIPETTLLTTRFVRVRRKIPHCQTGSSSF